MVAQQPVSQTARIVVEGTYGGVNTVNVFHWRKVTPVSPFTQSEINDLATQTRTLYSARFLALQNASYTLGTVTAWDLSSDTGVVGSQTGSSAGTKVGTATSANVAICVSWAIARRYRGGHPRTYFPGTVTGDMTGTRLWAGPTITAWDTAADGFLSSMNSVNLGSGASGQMVAVHRKRNHVDLIPVIVSTISGASCGARIDSQRRRLGKET